MKEYKPFVNLLATELKSFLEKPKKDWRETALKYVDGFAADELRRLVSLETRRENGTFFTDSELGKKVLSLLKPIFNKDSVIYDPACGVANLLISAADFIRNKNILIDENNLLGTDIYLEFVEAARLRLKLNQLIHNVEITNAEKIENSLIQADGLVSNEFYKKATHIFVNPPFNQIVSNDKLIWAKGKVSAAALFIEKIIENSNPGVSIIAILPDVLRSGSRYGKWRAIIEEKCIIENIKLLGQFDRYADVDVFALRLTKLKENIRTKRLNKSWQLNDTVAYEKTLSDLFEICVGPVVDNRDSREGTCLKYIVSRGLKGWDETGDVTLKRKHKGKSFRSPFIVIKRTSRVSDTHRAVATIINMPDPVYVDNHLIILKPKSGKISDCRKAIRGLRDRKTDAWINDQIRCRHLTIKIVCKIPVWT